MESSSGPSANSADSDKLVARLGLAMVAAILAACVGLLTLGR